LTQRLADARISSESTAATVDRIADALFISLAASIETSGYPVSAIFYSTG
jgi:hypothetical protein